MPPITYFYIFLTALCTSLLLVPPISRLAVSMGMMDRPDARKVHLREVPRLGGIAIFFAFMLALIFFLDIDRQGRGFLVGGVIMFMTGLADDIVSLTPRQKFAGEILAAVAAVVIGGLHLESLGNLLGMGELNLGIASIPFTVVAIVGVANAINLIDGLDGLASGVSAIAIIAFGILSFMTGNTGLTAMTAALLGAVVGFLKFNSYPAKIFMGDGGSLFLGYCLGFFSVDLVVYSGGRISEVTPLIVLAVPIVDTLYVMVKRMREGKQLFSPDKNHIHHRFLNLGIGHDYTVLTVYSLSYLLAVLAVTCYKIPDVFLALGLILTYAVIYLATCYLARTVTRKKSQMIGISRSIRRMVVCRRLIYSSRYMLIAIKYLVVAVLLLTLTLPWEAGHNTLKIAVVLFILSLGFIFLTNDWGNLFLRFVLYFDGAFILYWMENLGESATIGRVPVLVVSNILFCVLFFLVGMKMFLRKRTSQMINSPLDFLVFIAVISVSLLPANFSDSHHLLMVAGKSAILFASYKLILMRKASLNRKIIIATLAALVVIFVKGIS